VRAARNVGFELILNSFAHFPEEQPDLLNELYDRREESLPFYDILVELVRAGDGDAARSALRTAFNAMDQEWLSRHGHKSRGSAEKKPGEKKPSVLASKDSTKSSGKKKRS